MEGKLRRCDTAQKDLKKSQAVSVVCGDRAVCQVLIAVYGTELELSSSVQDAVRNAVA